MQSNLTVFRVNASPDATNPSLTLLAGGERGIRPGCRKRNPEAAAQALRAKDPYLEEIHTC